MPGERARAALQTMRPLVSRTPDIVRTTIESADGSSRMGEFQVD